jgi:hypothetical protein
VEEIETHGGSLRVYMSHPEEYPIDYSVKKIFHRELICNLNSNEFYDYFRNEVKSVKEKFWVFINSVKGKRIAGYGAAAKANTFLNFMVLTEKDIPFIADTTPAKQGKFMPGSKIPIVDEETLKAFDPEYVIIFPWNFKKEIMGRLRRKNLVSDSCQFVVFIPGIGIYK